MCLPFGLGVGSLGGSMIDAGIDATGSMLTVFS